MESDSVLVLNIAEGVDDALSASVPFALGPDDLLNCMYDYIDYSAQNICNEILNNFNFLPSRGLAPELFQPSAHTKNADGIGNGWYAQLPPKEMMTALAL